MLSSRRFLAAAVLAALAVRGWWAVAVGDSQRFYDSDSYITIASNLIAGKGFVWGDQLVGRPALYPLMVAAFSWEIFGRRFLALYLAQAVLGAATVLLFAAAARRLLGALEGGLTAALLAVYPFLVYYTGTVLSETLFVFFLAWVVLAVAALLGGGKMRWALAGGAAAGAAYLTRPSVLGLLFIFAAILIISAKRRRRAAALALAAAAVAFAATLPWALRNRAVTGRLVFSTSGIGASLYDGLGPQADGSSNMEFMREMSELSGMNEFERDRYLERKALSAAAESPLRVARLAVVKAGRLWSPVPNSERFRGAYAAVSLVAVLPVYVLALYAVARGAVPSLTLTLLAAGPVYFTLLHMVFVGSTRYRLPVMPLVVIAAAAGAVRLFGGNRGDREGSSTQSP